MLVKAAVDQQDWDTAAAYENFARPGLEMQLFNLCWLVVKGKAAKRGGGGSGSGHSGGNKGPGAELNLPLIRANLSEAWKTLDASLTPVLKESYASAYEQLSSVQTLGEFEEIIGFYELLASGQHVEARKYRQDMYGMWRRRMQGSYQSIPIWQQMMSVRSLAWSRSEEVYSRLKFAALCRKKGKTALSLKILKGASTPGCGSARGVCVALCARVLSFVCAGGDVSPRVAARLVWPCSHAYACIRPLRCYPSPCVPPWFVLLGGDGGGRGRGYTKACAWSWMSRWTSR